MRNLRFYVVVARVVAAVASPSLNSTSLQKRHDAPPDVSSFPT